MINAATPLVSMNMMFSLSVVELGSIDFPRFASCRACRGILRGPLVRR
jgi:hypothetical protein